MGFTDWIIKLSNAKFSRKFQYEPYIIKSTEYIDIKESETVLTIYKETDYMQSIITTHYVKNENYYSFETNQTINIDKKINKVILFFSLFDINKTHIETIKQVLKKDGKIYCITYLNDSKFFELTLKLIDKDEAKKLDKTENILDETGFILEDTANFTKQHVSVKKYKVGK